MKRQSFVKVVSLVLCLLTLVTLFAACDDGNTLQQTTTTKEEGKQLGTLGIIPEEIDYGDDVYKILLWDNTKNTLFPVQEVSGENIKNDLFARNKMIEEELGLKFDPIYMQSHMSGGTGGDELYNAALEGKDEYEALCCYSLYAGQLATKGRLVDLSGLEYPDSTMDWYPSSISEWEAKDRLFFIATNHSIRNIVANWCIYANNKMISEKKLEDIEDVVLRGDWTLGLMKDYSRNWAVEAEANDTKSEEKDRVYGFTYIHRTCIDAFYHAAGFKPMSRNAEGDPVFNFFAKGEVERISGFVDTFLDIAKSPECIPNHDAYDGNWTAPLKNQNAAFYAGALDLYTNIKADGTFSLIPLPKMNADQEKYYTIQVNAFEIWAVPKCGSDSTVGGLIIDAVCFDDYNNIAHKFFDLDFKYRYSDSEKGVKIFEMIRESWVADFSRVWWNIGSPYNSLRNCIAPEKGNLALKNTFANTIGGYKRSYEKGLRDVLAMVSAIKD